MATVNATTATVVTKTITVSLTGDEARLVAELLDDGAEDVRDARMSNPWLYDLINDLDDAASA